MKKNSWIIIFSVIFCFACSWFCYGEENLSFAKKPVMGVKLGVGYQLKGSFWSVNITEDALDDLGQHVLSVSLVSAGVDYGKVSSNFAFQTMNVGIVNFVPTFEIFPFENNKSFSLQFSFDVNFFKFVTNKQASKILNGGNLISSEEDDNAIEEFQEIGYLPHYCYDIAIEILPVYRLNVNNGFSIFVGAGVVFDTFASVFHAKTENNMPIYDENGLPTGNYYKMKTKHSYSILNFAVGACGLVGFGYEVSKNIILDLEYQCKYASDFIWGFRAGVNFRF